MNKIRSTKLKFMSMLTLMFIFPLSSFKGLIMPQMVPQWDLIRDYKLLVKSLTLLGCRVLSHMERTRA